MKFLINSKKINHICVWAWTENTNYRCLSTPKYGGFTNFIIFGHIFDTGFTHVDLPGHYLEGGSIWTFGVSMFVDFALMRQN